MRSSSPTIFKPSGGGRFMPGISHENVGAANYTLKRNWRRKLDREIRAEGFAKFCPKVIGGLIPMPATADDITLSIMMRHPNGRTAIVVGTATTLWKYAGAEDPLYVAAGYVDANYTEETLTAWRQIGSGFSPTGQRWEVELINGYLILNNGADLPMTYRLTDDAVEPIYELRELAVASVGCITQLNGILMCGDIRQIKDGKFEEIMTAIPSSANCGVTGLAKSGEIAVINSGTLGVAGNTITANGTNFAGGLGFSGLDLGGSGTKIRMLNGVERKVISVTSPTIATVDGDPVLVEGNQSFSFFPVDNEQYLRMMDLPKFTTMPGVPISIGTRLFWDSGESRTITDIFEADDIFLNSDIPISSGPFKIENLKSYARFEDESYIDRVGWRVLWSLPDQPRRFGSTATGKISPVSNVLTLDYPVRSVGFGGGEILLAGMSAGNLPCRAIYSDGLRMLIGDLAITGFYEDVLSGFEDAVALELSALLAKNQAESTLASANDALVKAGEYAADLPDDADRAALKTAASSAVDIALATLSASELALTNATKVRVEAEAKAHEEESVEFQLFDSVSSIPRSEDLQDDGSNIVKMLPLRNLIVIYKETSIFLARYSGVTFAFQLIKIPKSSELFYRNTLIDVDGLYHLYASDGQFCRFDLTNQIPVPIPEFQACQDVFFNQVSRADMNAVFAADNELSAEILFCFPSGGLDRCLAFDYNYNTISTRDIPMTSGATVVMPGSSQEKVFIMGGAAGLVMRYGLTNGKVRTMSGTASKTGANVTTSSGVWNESDIGKTVVFANGLRFGIVGYTSPTIVVVAGSGNVTAQAFQVDPSCHHYDGLSYSSTMQSGADGFGSEESSKNLNRHDMMVSGFSPNTQIALTIRSGREVNGVEDKISNTLTPPKTMTPTLLSDHFIGDRIEVSGINNPIELTSRSFSVSRAQSRGFGRRKE